MMMDNREILESDTTNPEANVIPDNVHGPMPDVERPRLSRNDQKHARAGVTKNHGRGESKARRRMVRESRKRNRGR